MIFNNLITLTLLSVSMMLSCGAQTKTGRNADPSQWPFDPTAEDSGAGQGPGTSNELAATCFERKSRDIPEGLGRLCENEIKTNPAFARLHKILCEDRQIFSALTVTKCGWNGAASTINQHIHYYEVEQDIQKDYEDVHGSIVYVPVPIEKFMSPFRLAFENFDKFKADGFQWVAGTREHRNLSGTKWEEGINYRFRANKDLYDIGYQGNIRLYDLGPDTYAHLNYATGDLARILEFAQIVIYKRQPNNTTMSIKLEHRKVSSQGLFDRAKKTSHELTREIMEKGLKNAEK